MACLSVGTPPWKLFIKWLALFINCLALFINCLTLFKKLLTLFINFLTLFINYLTLFINYLNIFINTIWCYLSNVAYILILHGCFPLVTGLVSHGGNSNLGYCVITHPFFRYYWMIFFKISLGALRTFFYRSLVQEIWKHLTFCIYVFLNSRIGAISVRFVNNYIWWSVYSFCYDSWWFLQV